MLKDKSRFHTTPCTLCPCKWVISLENTKNVSFVDKTMFEREKLRGNFNARVRPLVRLETTSSDSSFAKIARF